MFHRWLLFFGFLALKTNAYSYPRPNNNNQVINPVPDKHDFNECVKGCECTISNGKNLLNCANMGLLESRLDLIENDYLPEILDLSNNSIEYMNSDLILTEIQRKSVKTLDLRNNKIKKFDRQFFKQFPNLRTLYLNNNNLGEAFNNKAQSEQFAGFWQDAELLEALYLDNNDINYISASTFRSLTLQTLHLNGNNLSTIYLSFDQAPMLEELSLNNCGIKRLSLFQYGIMANLKRLYLAENPVLSFSFTPQTITPKLEVLDLSRTHFINLPSNWIQSTTLKELRLRSMPFLHTIQNCGFCGVPNLNSLELQLSPNLEEIHSNAFGKKKPKLERLNLEHCNLKTLSKDLLEWQNVKDLFIGSNPYNCDEKLRWLIEDKQINIEKVGPEPTCAEPKELLGQRLRDISVIQNVKKSTQGPKQSNHKPMESTWYSWFKHLPKTTPEYKHKYDRTDIYETTEFPYKSFNRKSLSSQYVQKLRQWIEQVKRFIREFSQDPLTLFVSGFIAGIFALLALYGVYKLICVILCLLWKLSVNYLIPGLFFVAKFVVIPLIAIVKLLALGIVILIGWLTNTSVDKIRDFYLERENYIRLMAEKGKNHTTSLMRNQYNPNTSPVVIYDPVSEQASTVE